MLSPIACSNPGSWGRCTGLSKVTQNTESRTPRFTSSRSKKDATQRRCKCPRNDSHAPHELPSTHVFKKALERHPAPQANTSNAPMEVLLLLLTSLLLSLAEALAPILLTEVLGLRDFLVSVDRIWIWTTLMRMRSGRNQHHENHSHLTPLFRHTSCILDSRSCPLVVFCSYATPNVKSNFLRCRFTASPIDPRVCASAQVTTVKKLMPDPGKGQASFLSTDNSI